MVNTNTDTFRRAHEALRMAEMLSRASSTDAEKRIVLKALDDVSAIIRDLRDRHAVH